MKLLLRGYMREQSDYSDLSVLTMSQRLAQSMRPLKEDERLKGSMVVEKKENSARGQAFIRASDAIFGFWRCSFSGNYLEWNYVVANHCFQLYSDSLHTSERGVELNTPSDMKSA